MFVMLVEWEGLWSFLVISWWSSGFAVFARGLLVVTVVVVLRYCLGIVQGSGSTLQDGAESKEP